MADNSTQGGTDTIRDKDRAGVKTQIFGTDLNIGGASEVLETAAALADGTANPTTSGRSAFGLLWNGTTWDRAPGNAASGAKVQSAQLPAALVSGRLDVNIGASGLSSLAINNIETIADNAAFVDGTSKLFPQGYIFDETAGTGLTENDIAAARVDSKRAVVNVLEDATTRGRRAVVSATGGLLGDQGAPAVQANAWFVRPRKLITYRAIFRAATSPWYLTQATTANTKHQQLTIHHAAAAIKTVKLRHLWYAIVGNTVAGIGHVTLYRLTSGTTPATGNPVITPTAASSADAAAEVTCLVKPTTAGTEGALVSHNLGNIGVAAPNTATASLMSPMVDLIEMAPHHDDESKPLEIRAGVLEGYGVSIEMSSVTNISLIFIAELTEE